MCSNNTPKSRTQRPPPKPTSIPVKPPNELLSSFVLRCSFVLRLTTPAPSSYFALVLKGAFKKGSAVWSPAVLMHKQQSNDTSPCKPAAANLSSRVSVVPSV